MALQTVKRLPATDVKTCFGRIIREIVTTETPVIVQNHGSDQAVLISLRDFRRLWPQEETRGGQERARVQAILQSAGLLSQPTPEMRQHAAAYDAQHSPQEQEHILAEWRSLTLVPPLSQVIQENRTQSIPLTFVSGDDALISAAQSEGLTVENPFWHL